MTDVQRRPRPGRASWPRSSLERYRRGERPVARRVRRRATPSWPTRSASCSRPWSMMEQLKPGAADADRPHRRRGRPRRRAARAARRLPHPPRGRPRRHGGRLRGRAGLARPPRGPEGPARRSARPTRGRCERFRREAQAGGAAAPHQHRAGLRRRRARRRPLLRHAVHPGPGPRRGPRRAAAAPAAEAGRPAPRPPTGRAARPRPRGASAADVARSLLTGRVRRAGARADPGDAGRPTAERADGRRRPPAAGRRPRRPTRRPTRRPSPAAGRAVGPSRRARTADYCAERGPDRRPGGRGAGLRPRARAILHRDIKPSNLLLDAAGHGLGHRLRPGQGRRPATT